MGKKFSKVIVMSMCAIMMIFAIPKMDVYASKSLTSTEIANYFNSKVGASVPQASCLAFIADGFAALGATRSSSCCAYNYGSSYIVSTSMDNIPVGADVFLNWNSKYSYTKYVCPTCGQYCHHIGVYVGDGYVVHTSGGKVIKTSLSDLVNYWNMDFRGWGYHGNIIISDSASYNPFSNVYTSNISDTNAQVNGELASLQYVTEAGFYISKNADMSGYTQVREILNTQVKTMWYDMNKWYGTLEYGTKYYYQLYAIINGTQYFTSVQSFTTTGDNLNPEITFVTTDKWTDSGYWVLCEVSDNVKVEKVCFPTWSEVGGQDDLAQEWPTQLTPISGNTYGYEVKFSEHNNDYGIYNTHIYAYDSTGNYSMAGIIWERIKEIPLIDYTLSKTSITISGNEKIDIDVVSYVPSNTNVNLEEHWFSSDESVATVSSTGEVTGVGNGTATILCSIAGVVKTCTVTVNFDEIGVDLNTSSATLNSIGQTIQLTATVTPNNVANKNVIWKSSNTAVATVDENGLVKAVGNGTTTITVTTESGNKTATCQIVVNALVAPQFTVANVTGGVQIKWDFVDNATGYIVYRREPNGVFQKIAGYTDGKTKSYIDKNVVNGKAYFYAVKAINSTTQSTYTTKGINYKAALVAPTFTVANVSGGVQINWNFVDNATGYIVYRREAGGVFSKIAGFTDGKTKSYTDKNVVDGKAYFYAVKAINGTSQSTYTTKGITYKASLVAPTFTIENVVGGVQINWNFVDGATGYIVYRREPNGVFQKIAGYTDGKTKSYTDKNVVDGKAYFYAVKAINGTTQSTYTTKGINYKAALATPTFTVANVAGGVQINWNFVDNAVGYIIYRRDAGGTFSKIAGFTDGKTKSYIDTNVVDGKAYFYAVKAVNHTTQSTYTTKGINYKATTRNS